MLKRLNALFGAQDMTTGRPMTAFLRFSIPMLVGNFAQQLYSTVDSIIVGRYVGDRALSSIGTSLPIIRLLLVLFMAVSTGTGIMVAQYFGAKDKKSLSRTVGTAITLILAASGVIMAVGVPLAGSLLRLTNTPPETFEMARSYLTIMLAGVAFSGLYNILAGTLNGLGNSGFSLLALVISSLLNVVLDIWFVSGLRMGVGGAALATIISQGVSAIICIVKLSRMTDVLTMGFKTMVPEKNLTTDLIKLGLPAGLTQAVFSLSMVFTQALTNSMGYQVVTCTTAVMRIDGFAMLPNFTFGMAVATFVGQNIGAKKMDRVNQGTKDALRISLLTSVVLVAGLLFFGGTLIRMFTTTGEIIALGLRQIQILAPGYVAMAITQIFGGIMRGAGDTMPSMWISIFTVVVIRVPLAYVWAWFTRSPSYPAGSPDALFFSMLASWVLGAAITYLWYRRGTWKKKSVIRHEGEQAA